MKKREVKQKGYIKSEKVEKKERDLWGGFAEKEQLSPAQLAAFKQYYELLVMHNERYNLTAHTEVLSVIRHHFSDSLAVRAHIDLSTVKGLVDIGTGAGFPALPLKIMFPELPMVLIEPNKKRQGFLTEVIRILGMEDINIFNNDWRTFVRTTTGDLDLFVSRATLPVKELARVFKPSSAYNEGTLVYWASAQWEPEKEVAPLITDEQSYRVGSRDRRLIFMQKQKSAV